MMLFKKATSKLPAMTGDGQRLAVNEDARTQKTC